MLKAKSMKEILPCHVQQHPHQHGWVPVEHWAIESEPGLTRACLSPSHFAQGGASTRFATSSLNFRAGSTIWNHLGILLFSESGSSNDISQNGVIFHHSKVDIVSQS